MRYVMKKLVVKNFTASREVLRWIGNLLYRPGDPGLPINNLGAEPQGMLFS
jgi:hypothetical protein